ncbi:MAG: hypothetical protein EXQ56_03270 [Acidobacteria bacterium]|nr:hypothetical protein [Acidobacteriota bacterium]
MLLVSVPYALKAGDAETLGWLPASAYALSVDALSRRVSQAGGLVGDRASASASASAGDSLPTASATTTDFIAKFLNGTGALTDSVIREDTANGRIGVGIFPTSLLHVAAPGQAKLTVEATTGDAQIDFSSSGAGGRSWLFQTGDTSSGLNGLWRLIDSTAGQTRFVIDATGKAGFGVATPLSALHVAAPGQAALRVEATSGDAQINFAATGAGGRTWLFQTGYTSSGLNGLWRLIDSTAGQTRFVIDATGKAGFGVETPASALHVKAPGQAKLTVEANGGDAQIDFKSTGAGGRSWLFQTGDTASTLNGRWRLIDSTAGQERMTVD